MLQKISEGLKTVSVKAWKYKVTAVILVGGSGLRAGGELPKQHRELLGVPVVVRTLQAFSMADCIDAVVIVCRNEDKDLYREYCATYTLSKVVSVVAGGNTRQESAFKGMQALPDDTDYIAIHDGARCLVTPDEIRRVVLDAVTYKAATAATAAVDTVKISTLDGGFSLPKGQPDRSRVYQIQTPQVFDVNLYRAAAYVARNDHYMGTDDCSLVENLGHRCRLTLCSRENMKITTPEDFILAEALLGYREKGAKGADI